MNTEIAVELLKELQRTTEQLPKYDQSLVQKVIEETNRKQEQLHEMVKQKKYEDTISKTKLHILNYMIERNEQILTSYHLERGKKLIEMRWDFGSVIPNQIRENITQNEESFHHEYCQILEDYMNSLDLDLTQDHQPPSNDLYIEVRVLKDYGQIFIDGGQSIVELKKNSRLFLRRVDAENLIREGVLEHIISN
ncbi:partner of sld5 [Anaeramoeba ignava]|uniref:Partner of sld5 n=1 Tax=Anaeramoeba ignava TaxID=1746090 RepID=A0A9Q0RGB1_ANAIG|nr:partner of sld5 [Anaeramoeba ignava]